MLSHREDVSVSVVSPPVFVPQMNKSLMTDMFSSLVNIHDTLSGVQKSINDIIELVSNTTRQTDRETRRQEGGKEVVEGKRERGRKEGRIGRCLPGTLGYYSVDNLSCWTVHS